MTLKHFCFFRSLQQKKRPVNQVRICSKRGKQKQPKRAETSRNDPKKLRNQFARIHTSSLIKIEKTLNRPITKFYNGDDVNVITAELWLAKTRPTSFDKKHNLL